MAKLRAVATSLGLRDVATYVQSGNLVFRSAHKGDDPQRASLSEALREAFRESLKVDVPVVVVEADGFALRAASQPFGAVDETRQRTVHLGFAQGKIDPLARATLAARCSAKERVAVVGDALWVDYGDGAAKSHLSPSVLDKAVGSAVTMRNLEAVAALGAMLSRL